MLQNRRLFIASSMAAAATAALPAHANDLVINGPAPDFSARIFGGRDVSLADYRGQVLIINFWATWCGPCKVELPLLNSYYLVADQNNYGLKILAVTTEDSLPLSDLQPLAAKVSFDMARHFHGPYGVQKALPTNYIIDRNGILRYAQAGAFNLDKLNELLVPLLQHPKPDAEPAAPTKAAYRPG